jgi:myosin-9
MVHVDSDGSKWNSGKMNILIYSDRKDVEKFLGSLQLNPTNYQLGASKIFLRESEKIKLDYFLHQQIMTSIVKIQRWYRVALERRHFLRIQEAVIKIQVSK